MDNLEDKLNACSNEDNDLEFNENSPSLRKF